MIPITRATARTLLAVFRKATDLQNRAKPMAVAFVADDAGLRIQARGGAVGVQYHMPGSFPTETLNLPFAALGDLAGASPAPVRLIPEPSGSVRAEWTDAGVPQRRIYAAPSVLSWLDTPQHMDDGGNGLLNSLTEAMSAATVSHVKFAMNNVQLRGLKGEAVGSDGRQLLIVRGLEFPWKENLLVPSTRLFEAKAFKDAKGIEIARTDDHVVIRTGPWTVWLTVDKNGRYPDVDGVIPMETSDSSRVVLNNDDADFLAKSLPRLPADDADQSPVTLHANGQVVVRAKSEAAPLTELILSRSRTIGREVRVATDRTFLKRAAELGIRNFRFVDNDRPIVGESNRHLYVWVPLSSTIALKSTDDALRIESAAPTNRISDPQPLPRNDTPMSKSIDHHDDPEIETPEEVNFDPIQETNELRENLFAVLRRVKRLSIALKRQRKQTQLVRTTLASLKQLQNVA